MNVQVIHEWFKQLRTFPSYLEMSEWVRVPFHQQEAMETDMDKTLKLESRPIHGAVLRKMANLCVVTVGVASNSMCGPVVEERVQGQNSWMAVLRLWVEEPIPGRNMAMLWE